MEKCKTLQGQKNRRQEEARDKKNGKRRQRREWRADRRMAKFTVCHLNHDTSVDKDVHFLLFVKFYQFIKTSAVHISSRQKAISLEEYLWLAETEENR